MKMEIDQEKKALLEQARKKVDKANKFRLAFLFIAVIGLVFIYFGNKMWDGMAWYDNAVANLYLVLFGDIFLMLIATIVKIIFVTKYNKVVKNL